MPLNRAVIDGVYHWLTKNLTLLSEVSDVHLKAQNSEAGDSLNVSAGAFR